MTERVQSVFKELKSFDKSNFAAIAFDFLSDRFINVSAASAAETEETLMVLENLDKPSAIDDILKIVLDHVKSTLTTGTSHNFIQISIIKVIASNTYYVSVLNEIVQIVKDGKSTDRVYSLSDSERGVFKHETKHCLKKLATTFHELYAEYVTYIQFECKAPSNLKLASCTYILPKLNGFTSNGVEFEIYSNDDSEDHLFMFPDWETAKTFIEQNQQALEIVWSIIK